MNQSQKPETQTIEWDTKGMTEESAEKIANTKPGRRPEIARSRRRRLESGSKLDPKNALSSCTSPEVVAFLHCRPQRAAFSALCLVIRRIRRLSACPSLLRCSPWLHSIPS